MHSKHYSNFETWLKRSFNFFLISKRGNFHHIKLITACSLLLFKGKQSREPIILNYLPIILLIKMVKRIYEGGIDREKENSKWQTFQQIQFQDYLPKLSISTPHPPPPTQPPIPRHTYTHIYTSHPPFPFHCCEKRVKVKGNLQ